MTHGPERRARSASCTIRAAGRSVERRGGSERLLLAAIHRSVSTAAPPPEHELLRHSPDLLSPRQGADDTRPPVVQDGTRPSTEWRHPSGHRAPSGCTGEQVLDQRSALVHGGAANELAAHIETAHQRWRPGALELGAKSSAHTRPYCTSARRPPHPVGAKPTTRRRHRAGALTVGATGRARPRCPSICSISERTTAGPGRRCRTAHVARKCGYPARISSEPSPVTPPCSRPRARRGSRVLGHAVRVEADGFRVPGGVGEVVGQSAWRVGIGQKTR